MLVRYTLRTIFLLLLPIWRQRSRLLGTVPSDVCAEMEKSRAPFTPTKTFQHNAKQMQELAGGPWGEMRVMLGYLFWGWNCRGPVKCRGMLTYTEEIGRVEMIATLVAGLEDTPVPCDSQGPEMSEVAYGFMIFSGSEESAAGR